MICEKCEKQRSVTVDRRMFHVADHTTVCCYEFNHFTLKESHTALWLKFYFNPQIQQF